MRKVVAGVLLGMLAAGQAGAQVRTIDPNRAGTLAPDRRSGQMNQAEEVEPVGSPDPSPEYPSRPVPPAVVHQTETETVGANQPPPASKAERDARAAAENTYRQQDVLTAADGVFGQGTSGLARLVERIFHDQGEPTAYIAGHEAGGAFIVGLRYGSGTLFHKVEGQRPVNWTGPSVGFDVGGSASKVFVLVYNLYDSQELYRRFPAAEGQVYVVGGFTASYLRWKDTVLIPIRLGVGWRLGANVGYMNFTEKMRLLPF